MDDLEYSEFLEYPCRICGSIEYRYYGGGYNCREGHRNEELREQLADEDDFDFNRSQMRSTQLSQSKMTTQTARVATKKYRKRSGKGDHDVNLRYGITEERQGELFEEERTRFQRKGDKRRHLILEASMQILILQIDSIKKHFPDFWRHFGADEMIINSKQEEFETLARKLFRAYANELSFPYSHTDALHPELSALAPPFKPSKYFCRKSNVGTNEESGATSNVNFDDELDKELMLEDYDYGNESSVSDSDAEEMGMDVDYNIPETEVEAEMKIEMGRLLEMKNTNSAPSDTPANFKATRFPSKISRPLKNAYSYLNMTFLTYLALVHMGIPVLFSDLARALELGDIPGYRPDFQLSKDIVTVRFNINEIRAFHTRFLPHTDQLYYDSRLMLEMLSRRCRVADWILDEDSGDALLLRLMGEMSLPSSYFSFIKSQVKNCIGSSLSFVVLTGDLYLSPCALLSAAIVFFLRLLYTLEDCDCDCDNDCDCDCQSHVINERLRSQGLPTQTDLVEKWNESIRHCTLFTETEGPVTDAIEYTQLLEMANRMISPTRILDNKISIKGIFGSDQYDNVLNLPRKDREKIKMADYTTRMDEIVLPCDNFSRYRSYPESINMNALPTPYKTVLRLIQKLVGIRPADLESLVRRIYEAQDPGVLESDRVVSYRKFGGRRREKVESEVYMFY